MCLYTDQREPIVLKEDLIVYKVLKRKVTWLFFVKLCSPLFAFIWKKNRLYTTTMMRYGNTIEDGFHANLNATRAFYQFGSSRSKRYAYTFKIPCGAEVFYSQDGYDVVSNKMILLSTKPIKF